MIKYELPKRKTFEKGFTINWTDKIYTITQVLKALPPTYKIRDDKEEIEGTFYQQELQKTNENTFRIEKVLRRIKTPRMEQDWLVLNG